MRKLTRINILIMVSIITGILFIQSCKKENEVTVRAQIEDTWYAQTVTNKYTDDEGDGSSVTDADQDWSIKFDQGNYTIDGGWDNFNKNGTYSINGNKLTLYPNMGDPRTWTVKELNDTRLIASYTDSDDEGEFKSTIEFINKNE